MIFHQTERPARQAVKGLLRSVWRARFGAALIGLLLLGACVFPWPRPTAAPVVETSPPSAPVPSDVPTAVPSDVPTAVPSDVPTAVPSDVPMPATPRATPPQAPTSTPSDLHITSAGVAFYPGPTHYSGDIVTIEVTPYNVGEINPHEIAVRVYRETSDQAEVIAEGNVGYVSFDQVPRARLVWAWDTAGLQGEQALTIWLDPDDVIQEGDEYQDNNAVTLTLQLRPVSELPEVEVSSTWVITTTECCILHYLTGSGAERDLVSIAAVAAGAVAHAEERLGAELAEPFEIYLISRVIAHGGYARQELVISYLDRHYASRDLEVVIRHEATHVLDSLVLTGWSPSMLREGLAVWVTGGHFKQEPLALHASALLELDWYIPLEPLANNFYREQHEIGYLEGGAFVDYLVETYGWDRFLDFYTSFNEITGETPADTLDLALTEAFAVGLADTEGAFLDWLRAHPPAPEHVRDLETSIYFFDTVRHYQEYYDPMAFFMVGWLPDPVAGEEQSIEADFLRHPRSAENVALETMLIAARDAQLAGAFDRAWELLDTINLVVEGSFTGTLAADYLAVVEAVAAAGYEAQTIAIEGATARVEAIADWPNLAELVLQQTDAGWVLSEEEVFR